MKREKVCVVCESVKPILDFPLRGRYRLKSCSICYNNKEAIKYRKQYQENPEFKLKKIQNSRKYGWKHRYNTTEEIVYKTLELQNNKCANKSCNVDISLDPFQTTVKRAVLDHDHSTGKFRSLLCDRCNILLGHIENNEQLFYGLLNYAKFFKEKD